MYSQVYIVVDALDEFQIISGSNNRLISNQSELLCNFKAHS